MEDLTRRLARAQEDLRRARDISEPKGAEEKIKRLASFPLSNPNPVLEVDVSGAITFFNQAAADALEKLGREGDPAAFLPGDLPEIQAAARLKGEKTFYREVSIGDKVFGENLYFAEDFDALRVFAVDITPRQQVERELRESKTLLEKTFNNLHDALILVDPQTRTITACNPAVEQVFGYRPEEILGRSTKLFHLDEAHHQELGRRMFAALDRDGVFEDEFQFRRRDGNIIVGHLTVSDIRDDSGRRQTLLGLNRDVTAEREAREALVRAKEEWEATFNAVPDLIAILDDKHHIVRTNRAMAEALGTTPDKLAGRPCHEVMHNASGPPAFCPHSQLLADGRQHTAEVHELGRDFLVTASPLKDDQGKVMGSVHVARDITARQRAEEEKQAAAQRVQAVLESISDGFLALDENLVVTYFNRAAEQLLGRRAEEVVGRHLFEEAFPEAKGSIFEEKYIWALRAKEAFTFEAYFEPHENWFDVRVFPYENGISVYFQRTTERKRAEEAQRDSEERFRTMANAIPQLAWIAKSDGYIIWYNRRWYDYTGTTPADMEGWGWQSVHDPEVLPQVLKQWRASIATGMPFDMVFPLRRADGEFRQFLTRVMPMKGADGRVIQWFGTNTDVTERKRAEEALRESGERLRLAQQVARIGTFELNIQTGVNTWTPELEAMYGLPPNGFPQTQTAWESLVHPDDRTEALRGVERAFETGEPEEGEWRVVWSDGSVHWLAGRWQVFKDDSGRPLRMTGINIDITARKQAEEALKRAHDELEQRVKERTRDLEFTVAQLQAEVTERQRAEEALAQHTARVQDLYNNAPCGYHSLDAAGTFVQINDTELAWLGYTRDEVLGRLKFTDLLTPGSLKKFQKNFPLFKERGWVRDLEFDLLRRDGTVLPVLLNATVVTDARGNYRMSRSTVVDISQRRQAEEFTRDLFTSSLIGLYTIQDKKFRLINPGFREITGYDEEEIKDLDFQSLVYPEDREMCRDRAVQMLKGTNPRPYEYRVITKGGEVRWILETVVSTRYQGRRASLGNFMDITARKQAQEALAAERRRLFALMEQIPAYVVLLAPDYTVPFANREFVRRFGEAEAGQKCYEFLFGRTQPCPDCQTFKVLESHESQEWEWLGPDGRSYAIYDYPFTDVDGSPLIMEMGIDITDRKAAEAGIRRKGAILEGVNRILRETLTCGSVAELSRTCLKVAEELTGSKFGFINELNQEGSLRPLAFSDLGWQACRMPREQAQELLHDLKPRGLFGKAVKDEQSFIANNPPSHPESGGLPEGHPPITSFMGVPLKHGGKTMGLIGLANKAGGFDTADQEALDTLAVAIVEALMRFRAEKKALSASRLYRLLSEVNETIVRASGQSTLFQEVCRIAVESGGFRLAWIGTIDPDHSAVKAVARYGFEDGYLEDLLIPLEDVPESRGPTGVAVREARYDVCNDLVTDPRMAPWREKALARGYRSSGAFPLRVGAKVVGALTLYADRPGFFNQEEIALLESMAADLSFALESMDREAKRRQAEEDLKESEERLRYLTSQLMTTQERERKRIAAELHDELGQALAVLKLHLRALERQLRPEQQSLKTDMLEILEYLGEVIENVRRLYRDLSPKVLEDLGLTAALQDLINDFADSYQLEHLEVSLDNIDQAFPPAAQTVIYRILQEILNNIVKHSGCSRVAITLRKEAGHTVFKVEDNGKGFDAAGAPGERGVGLTALEERVRMLGGNLDFWSRENQGTRVTFSIPTQ